MGCIYVITNLVNGRQYVGRTVDANKRWSVHRSTLRSGHHSSPALQKDWLEFGEDAFEFVVLQEVDDDALEGAEVAEIATRKPYYNIHGVSPNTRHSSAAPAEESSHDLYNVFIKTAGGWIPLAFKLHRLLRQLLTDPSEAHIQEARTFVDSFRDTLLYQKMITEQGSIDFDNQPPMDNVLLEEMRREETGEVLRLVEGRRLYDRH